MIDEISPHRHKGNRTSGAFDNPDSLIFQDMIAELVLIFVEEMTFGALELRQRFFARNPPQDRNSVEIFRTKLTQAEVIWGHRPDQKKN